MTLYNDWRVSLYIACILPNLSKSDLSARKSVMARERTEAAMQPMIMWSIRMKALTGVIPPSKIPHSNRGIDVRPSTVRLAIVGDMTASRLRRRKGRRAWKWEAPLPRRNSYCCSSAFRAET